MEPTIFEQISTKIDELNNLLDSADARAMSNDEVRENQLLSAKVHSAARVSLQTLLDRPTLYADRLNRQEFAGHLDTYDRIPSLQQKLQTCISKSSGWRIGSGHSINKVMLRYYRLLGADLPEMPDLRSEYDRLGALYKKGKRNGKNSNNNNNNSANNNTNTNTNTSDTSGTPEVLPAA